MASGVHSLPLKGQIRITYLTKSQIHIRRLGGRSPEHWLLTKNNWTNWLNKRLDEQSSIEQLSIEQLNLWTNNEFNNPLLNRCSPTKLPEQLNKCTLKNTVLASKAGWMRLLHVFSSDKIRMSFQQQIWLKNSKNWLQNENCHFVVNFCYFSTKFAAENSFLSYQRQSLVTGGQRSDTVI